MSQLPFELALALRYLRPKRTFVSVITLISIIGVMLGVAVLIIAISVMSGFDEEWHQRILGFNAHLKVVKPDAPMEDYALAATIVRSNQHVKGVAPFVMGQVMIETQPESGSPQIGAPVVRGIDPKLEGTVSILPKSVIQGKFDVSGNGLLVGREFAHLQGLKVGDRLAIYSPANLQKMREGMKHKREVAILPDDYEIRGIFDVGFADFNASVVVTSLENAQDLYGLDEAIHGLLVVLDNPFKVTEVCQELQPLLGGQFQLRTWMEDYSEIFDALVVEKNMIRFLLFFIVIVAAFGITSSQITFVVQKTREIGMLKALGATNGQITSLFLGQSLIVGAMGVSAGLGLGLLALAYRNEFLGLMNRLIGFQLLPPNIYKLYELPVLILSSDLAIICGGSLGICLLAGVIPAWIAGRLKPVEALRHE